MRCLVEKNSMPKVSVLMSVYNCENTVKKSIDSIVEQTFTDWELIICDDGSKDNTYKLNNYLPCIVKNDGTWNVDDPIYPFHLILKEEGSEKEVKTEIGFLTVDGQRRLTITLSPGCYSNKYVYTFEQISE